MKKALIVSASILAAILLIFAIGPRVKADNLHYTIQDYSNLDLDSLVFSQESVHPNLISSCEAKIIWADSTKQKTEYAIVYLPGFTACQIEGAPVHVEIAQKFNANLYLARLYDHGLKSDNALATLTPGNYYQSALDAVAIGKALGKKVILMGTSTGCTFAIDFAAKDPEIEALVLYSPNVDLYDKKSHLLTLPWGLQISKIFHGGTHNTGSYIENKENKYWQSSYRLEAQIALRALLDVLMVNDNFEKITQPVFIGYYYKDAENFDKVVSIDAMENFFNTIKTPESEKKMVAFSESENHVLIFVDKPESYKRVQQETEEFMRKIVIKDN